MLKYTKTIRLRLSKYRRPTTPSALDFLKDLRFSFPVPVVGPSAEDFYLLQRAKFSSRRFFQSRTVFPDAPSINPDLTPRSRYKREPWNVTWAAWSKFKLRRRALLNFWRVVLIWLFRVESLLYITCVQIQSRAPCVLSSDRVWITESY